jgi:hypothetical protein
MTDHLQSRRPTAPSSPRETSDRTCPYCDDRSIVRLGHVMAAATGIPRNDRCSQLLKGFRAPPLAEDTLVFAPRRPESFIEHLISTWLIVRSSSAA